MTLERCAAPALGRARGTARPGPAPGATQSAEGLPALERRGTQHVVVDSVVNFMTVRYGHSTVGLVGAVQASCQLPRRQVLPPTPAPRPAAVALPWPAHSARCRLNCPHAQPRPEPRVRPSMIRLARWLVRLCYVMLCYVMLCYVMLARWLVRL